MDLFNHPRRAARRRRAVPHSRLSPPAERMGRLHLPCRPGHRKVRRTAGFTRTCSRCPPGGRHARRAAASCRSAPASPAPCYLVHGYLPGMRVGFHPLRVGIPGARRSDLGTSRSRSMRIDLRDGGWGLCRIVHVVLDGIVVADGNLLFPTVFQTCPKPGAAPCMAR